VSEQQVDEPGNDWARRAGMGFVWWCLPLGIGVAASYLAVAPRAAALVWMVLFGWMATGCTLNALRCHRLHCYISGSAFFLGAAALAFLAAGIALLGSHSLNNIVAITLATALLSFVPEMIWRKYL
jgi:hypothetical protein